MVSVQQLATQAWEGEGYNVAVVFEDVSDCERL